MKNKENIYRPVDVVIKDIVPLTEDVSMFVMDTKAEFSPGQFYMLSVFGHGEVPISITSDPSEPLMFSIKKVGSVTGALHELRPGDTIGLRGPYGNEFPLALAKGKDVIMMAGGIGVVPLRPIIHEFVNNNDQYGRVFLLYGCRDTEKRLYKDEVAQWEAAGIKIIYGLRGKLLNGADGCSREPHHLEQVDIDFSRAVAYVCGPHAMIDFSMQELQRRGMPDDMIITSLEAHMKCGLGKCGHCYIGPLYICTNGPVFSYRQIKALEHQ